MSRRYGVGTRANAREKIKQQLQRRSSSGKISKDFDSGSLNAHAIPAKVAAKTRILLKENVMMNALLVKFVAASRRRKIL